MRKDMWRKGLVIGIIVLFVGASVVPLIGSRTITLKDTTRETSNSDWPCDCDIIVPDDYPTIQMAIDNASQYDSICVKQGTYPENITIEGNDKIGLTICGENRNNTIIYNYNYNYSDTVSIKSDKVTIQNFTIKREYSGDGISIFSDDITIKSNNILDVHGDGISIEDSNKVYILNNNITSSIRDGIFLIDSNEILIKNNRIVDNDEGIVSDVFGDYENISIINNYISDNRNGISIGTIIGLTISENDVINNRWNGIYISSSHNNIISYNNISNNDDGLNIRYTENNEIFKNTIINNELEGIYIYGGRTIKIKWNTIMENSEGINISRTFNTKIFLNTIKNNQKKGITLHQSENNDVYYNNIYNNEQLDALYYAGRKNLWFQNWWGKEFGIIKLISRKIVINDKPFNFISFDLFPAKREYELPP